MSYIGQGLPADTFQGFVTDSFTGDGSATTFTLSKEPFSEDTLIVVINNVIQKPTTNFTVSGTTLTIVGTAVADGDVIYAIHMGGPLPIGGASELDLNGASDKLILDTDADTTISADTDDQIDFKAGGTDIMSLTATTATINDGVTITVDDNSDNLTLVSTDADAGNGPNLRLYRNSGSPANSDLIGNIEFEGRNNNSEDVVYGAIEAQISDLSDGAEHGSVFFKSIISGTLQERFRLNDTSVVFNEGSIDSDFRIESDSQTHAFNLDSGNSKISINTSTASNYFRLHQPSADVVFYGVNENADPYGLQIKYQNASPDGSGNTFFEGIDGSAQRFRVNSDGDVLNHDGTYGTISDERIKQDIVDAGSQWEDIKAITVRKYKRKDDVRQYGADNAPLQIGVISQELEKISPHLVKEVTPSVGDILTNSIFGSLYTEEDVETQGDKPSKQVGEIKTLGEKVKAVKYSILYMKAIKALQEAQTRIETLETKVKALEDA
jgi:hypothetical protein